MSDQQPTDAPAPRQPMSQAKRRRLQQCFEHATRNSTKGDHDYAHKMFVQCVTGDPGNLVYAQSFLGNLQKKYHNNKKGGRLAGLKGAGARATIKKATGKEDWDTVIKSVCDVLALNPWDTQALLAMATACERLENDECELFYLKTALDANSKDADVNRRSALALERMGHFDQAIACWTRVQKAKPGDEEAQKMIANLTVNKTIKQGGYEEKVAEGSGEKTAEEPSRGAPAPKKLTPQQELENAIARQPEEIENYLQLADLHVQSDRLDEAEQVLSTALNASGGGDPTVRERLEDVQIQRAERRLEIAEKRAAEEKTEESNTLVKRIKAELNRLELEIYAARSERHPGNPALQYELGIRLKRAGKFNEAIRALQAARSDARHKISVLIELGDCFYFIKQYKLAMNNYAQAVDASDQRDSSQRKLALYRAGKLALGLKEVETAEKHLTELAGLDFSYKDVAQCLDKVGQLRDKEKRDDDS